jgi:hypothetical protein
VKRSDRDVRCAVVAGSRVAVPTRMKQARPLPRPDYLTVERTTVLQLARLSVTSLPEKRVLIAITYIS